jgi:phage I-like protein
MTKEDCKPMELSEVMALLEKAYPDRPPQKLIKAAACLMEEDDCGDDDGVDGAADDPYEDESAGQMAARQAEEMARCASDEERSQMAARHAGEKERFAKRKKKLEAQNGKEKSGMSSQQIAHFIAKHPMVVSMASELNQVRTAQAKSLAMQKVDAAVREGRLIPSQREWAIEYCAADEKGFEKFIRVQPKILRKGADSSFTACLGGPQQGVSSLTASEIEIFANLGLESKEQLEKCAAVKERWTLRFPRPRLLLDDSNSGRADA